jgi:uncharacterized membrane protein
MANITPTKDDVLELEEYRQAFEMDRHLTSLNWQMASILIAGVLAGLALTVPSHSKSFSASTLAISFLGLVGVVSWLCFVKRNRDIVNSALIRAREIEASHPDAEKRLLTRGLKATGKPEREEVIRGPDGFTIVRFLAFSFIFVLSVIMVYEIIRLTQLARLCLTGGF